ncbi:ATP-binding protein [Derxia gummosa]|uniref:histidine kinase n=1 Tax=Derxia gummosa DSM 723 TaxID=1121388 RepID=A0ABD8FDF4_9BURK
MQAIDKPAITAGEPPEPNAAARPADAFAPGPLAAEPRATGPVGVDNEAAVQAAAQAARVAELNLAERLAFAQKLAQAEQQLLQSEKMASIGQLAAGVAHEINNPIGFINSNLNTLRDYVSDLLRLIDAYESTPAEAAAVAEEIDLPFLREDVGSMIEESLDGIARVRRIVQDLKDFSHVDHGEWVWTDLHKNLDSTLNIVNNEVKYIADVKREFQPDMPLVHCNASQINQVFMNMLVNAAHAIRARVQAGDYKRGTITITTGVEGDDAVIGIADTGCGIAPEHLARIFDPFFTTKPVGQGTGLGLSLSYSIVRKHGGCITVKSTPGEGSRFSLCLPIKGGASPRAS